MNEHQNLTTQWFISLRDKICHEFELIEAEFSAENNLIEKFKRKQWNRIGGGGGVISLLKGKVFEKVGVNISTVYGQFPANFQKDIPGAELDPNFWASGISIVAHMFSPLVPAIHMNCRYINTTKSWFGGGIDLTPAFFDQTEYDYFHQQLKDICDSFDPNYYLKFSKQCEEYFFLPHRNEQRGIGGIFFDYMNTGDWIKDFEFIKAVGETFLETYSHIVRNKMNLTWTKEQKEVQLIKRGRYVEFNLLYDRGTKFGLMTNGNTEAILMSLPPEVKWL